jgi:hypothetical protein
MFVLCCEVCSQYYTDLEAMMGKNPRRTARIFWRRRRKTLIAKGLDGSRQIWIVLDLARWRNAPIGYFRVQRL